MRKQIVAGNWKMNKTFQEADELINSLLELMKKEDNTAEVVICPPSLYLELASDQANDTTLMIGSQNMSCNEFGAFTGEISAPMLASMGIDYCILGHSERRKYFNENHEMLAAKVEMALKYNIAPIFCCGEQLPERESGNHFEVVKGQIKKALFHLSEDDFSKITLAYEPVWAIGTGVTATSAQAQEMHLYIRDLIKEKYGDDVAQETTILYGGSCNAKNARELFSNPDVDGGLIGGASLKAEDFIKIVQAFD